MKTLIFIHGAESFSKEEDYQNFLKTTFAERHAGPWEDKIKPDWRVPIARSWKSTGGLVYYPTMPKKQNARYIEWGIVFESIIDKLLPEDEVILVGGSLGGCFLLKYFSENPPLPVHQIQSIHLIAACIEEGDFTAPTNYEALNSLGNKVHIWHAEDDPVVPFAVGKELAKMLPKAQTHFFDPEKGYGHFHGIERIPELEGILLKK